MAKKSSGGRRDDGPAARPSRGIRRAAGPGYDSTDYQTPDLPDYVVVKLHDDAPVGVAAMSFAAAPGMDAQADSLNRILGEYQIQAVTPHVPDVDRPPQPLAMAPAMGFAPASDRPGEDPAARLARFVQVVPKSGADAQVIARRLNRTNAVELAYVAPRPVPAAAPRAAPKRGGSRARARVAATPGATGAGPGTRNFEPVQGYLHDAPDGIGAMGVWGLPGGKGRGVTICDIEGNWNLTHADLPPGIATIGGTVINSQGWIDHGTAVLGEMVSVANGFGTVGIAHEAAAKVHPAVVNGVFNAAAAIVAAANALAAGDVILIELHAPGPNGNYVAMQFWAAIFAAIQVAVAKGIVVVEAAGNGGEDFDAALYNGSGLQRDSGAILVGAGVPPTNYFDADGFGSQFAGYSTLGPPRSRLWFSNFGAMVNVQGWGWNVATTGYGDLQGGASQDDWYTARFSGTSSASPIVAAAAASLQAMAIAKRGAPLTPADVRSILINSGTPQEAGPATPLSQRIGPLPNLVEAAKLI